MKLSNSTISAALASLAILTSGCDTIAEKTGYNECAEAAETAEGINGRIEQISRSDNQAYNDFLREIAFFIEHMDDEEKAFIESYLESNSSDALSSVLSAHNTIASSTYQIRSVSIAYSRAQDNLEGCILHPADPSSVRSRLERSFSDVLNDGFGYPLRTPEELSVAEAFPLSTDPIYVPDVERMSTEQLIDFLIELAKEGNIYAWENSLEKLAINLFLGVENDRAYNKLSSLLHALDRVDLDEHFSQDTEDESGQIYAYRANLQRDNWEKIVSRIVDRYVERIKEVLPTRGDGLIPDLSFLEADNITELRFALLDAIRINDARINFVLAQHLPLSVLVEVNDDINRYRQDPIEFNQEDLLALQELGVDLSLLVGKVSETIDLDAVLSGTETE